MAVESLASVSQALSQLFAPEIARQMNRQAVTAAALPVRIGQGDAKNVAWDAEFSGNSAGSVAEGSDVASGEFLTDVPVPATLPWATYRSSFQLTENELAAAARSVGSPTALLDMFGERVYNATTKLASVINADMISGTGVDGSGNPNVLGLLGGALAATGVYAGISRATYSEWAGNALANGGTARPLTLDLLYQLEQNIFTACGEAPNLIVTSAGVYRKYAGLFESIRMAMTPGSRLGVMGAGISGSGMSPDATGLDFEGMPILRDRNMTAGYLLMLNTNYIDIKHLPWVNPGDAFGFGGAMLRGDSGTSEPNTMTGIPARIVLLGKTGDAVKASMKAVVQLAVKRPNSCGSIADLSEV